MPTRNWRLTIDYGTRQTMTPGIRHTSLKALWISYPLSRAKWRHDASPLRRRRDWACWPGVARRRSRPYWSCVCPRRALSPTTTPSPSPSTVRRSRALVVRRRWRTTRCCNDGVASVARCDEKESGLVFTKNFSPYGFYLYALLLFGFPILRSQFFSARSLISLVMVQRYTMVAFFPWW